jgi:hypothetical protein
MHHTRHSLLSSRWLLSWLLPYLVLSLSNGGLHTHDYSAAVGRAQRLSSAGVVASHIVSRVATTECLACKWLASSSIYPTAPVNLSQAIPLLIPADVSKVPSPLHLHGNCGIRGPPAI